MPDRILILTECGAETGFGHLTRCSAIAEAFRDTGAEVELWVATDEVSQARLPRGAQPRNWYELSVTDAAELAAATAVMVDSLVASPAQVDRIAQCNPWIAVIDDWLRRPHDHGIVIDWTIGAEKFAYPQRHPAVRYLLGSRFCALRSEFAVTAVRDHASAPRQVLVTFGGSDPRGLTVPVLARLAQDFPALHRQVVVGGAVRDRAFIETLRDEHTSFHVACDARQMRTLMAEADLAICAGGQTLYELAAQGLPPVVVRVVDNQTDDLREFAAAGFTGLAGDWDAPELLDRVVVGVRALQSGAERQRRAAAGRACVDGRGARRLAAACREFWAGMVQPADVSATA